MSPPTKTESPGTYPALRQKTPANNMHRERRQFLPQWMRIAALAAAGVGPTRPALALASYPFRLGVASGSPRPTAVVLWTRLVSTPLSPAPFSLDPVQVRWDMAVFV